jgi:hypothetical protein
MEANVKSRNIKNSGFMPTEFCMGICMDYYIKICDLIKAILGEVLK